MEKLPRTLRRILLLLALALPMVAWQLWLAPARETRQAWSGNLIETTRSPRLLRLDAPGTHRRPRDYHHVWHVDLDGGGVREVEVPHRLWHHGEPGLPVVKRRGERWPEIDTDEYRDQQRRNREGTRRVLEVLTGQ